MFKRKVIPLADLIPGIIRQNGLETPLLQMRVLDSWDEIVGEAIQRYTQEKFIKNQTLFVKISNPALRSDLSMRRTELAQQLNAKVGSYVIADVRIY